MTALPASPAAEPVARTVAQGFKRATLILPAYNEAAALPTVLDGVFAVLDAGYEVIVVDDGSSDDTAGVARRYPCRVLRHRANRGKGAAIRTGLAHARSDLIVVMDADATYPAGAIPRIVELLAQHDLVRCNRPRDTAAMPLVNRVGNRLFDLVLAASHGLDGTDHLSGLYGLRREAVLTMQLESQGFDIEAEIGIKARVRGLRVTSFPIPYAARLGDKKLQPWRDGVVILGRILAMLLLFNPLVTFILPGVAVMALAMAGAALLSQGPLRTPFFGLDIHSFIIATLGILASFQLIVFGLAAALYGVEAGSRPAGWLRQLSARPVRLGAAAAGFLMSALAAGYLAWLTVRWLAAGAGLFFGTQNVVLASTVLVLGLQLLSAALFLSIFAGRLERLGQPSEVEGALDDARVDE
jgi:hypothetical protein